VRVRLKTNAKGSKAHLGERSGWATLNERSEIRRIGCKRRRDLGSERVVDVLNGLVCLIAGFEQLRALKEDERSVEVARLEDRAVSRLRVSCLASDFGRLEPEFSNFCSSRFGGSGGGDDQWTEVDEKTVRERWLTRVEVQSSSC
jgi:hypothetical protein